MFMVIVKILKIYLFFPNAPRVHDLLEAFN